MRSETLSTASWARWVMRLSRLSVSGAAAWATLRSGCCRDEAVAFGALGLFAVGKEVVFVCEGVVVLGVESMVVLGISGEADRSAIRLRGIRQPPCRVVGTPVMCRWRRCTLTTHRNVRRMLQRHALRAVAIRPVHRFDPKRLCDAKRCRALDIVLRCHLPCDSASCSRSAALARKSGSVFAPWNIYRAASTPRATASGSAPGAMRSKATSICASVVGVVDAIEVTLERGIKGLRKPGIRKRCWRNLTQRWIITVRHAPKHVVSHYGLTRRGVGWALIRFDASNRFPPIVIGRHSPEATVGVFPDVHLRLQTGLANAGRALVWQDPALDVEVNGFAQHSRLRTVRSVDSCQPTGVTQHPHVRPAHPKRLGRLVEGKGLCRRGRRIRHMCNLKLGASIGHG